MVKNPPRRILQCRRQMQFQSLGQEDPLEEEMATYSSILAWEIPWTAEPSRLESMGPQRVEHDFMTNPWNFPTDSSVFFFKSLLNLLQYCLCFMF